ncbi:hypothetical protein QJQ45_014952 [Haematococcus lacustris]|nr:hypothetical protein QJQ45_014952 [Haematococcus lacustris]
MPPKGQRKRPVSPAQSAAGKPLRWFKGASGSGQHDQGQGQAVKKVIAERRQVIKAAPRPQAPPGGRWLDRDTNGCLNLQRIGESRQRPIELCRWDDLEALPPIGHQQGYQQGYKLVNDRLPKGRQWLHRAAEYRRGIDGRARNNA